MKALGATIREIRKERRYSITYVHHETRLAHQAIAKIERGKTHPKFDTLLNICRVLDIKPSELMAIAETRL